MSDQELAKHLWNQPEAQPPLSDQDRALLLEQYKLYVELADRVSGRRDTMNTFFLTLNGLVLGASPAVIEKLSRYQCRWYVLLPYLVACTQLFFWRQLIVAYKKLNGAKFRIVGEMETKLPATPYGGAEWRYLLKEGKDRKAYWPLTHLETKIPWVFFVGYTIATALVIFGGAS